MFQAGHLATAGAGVDPDEKCERASCRVEVGEPAWQAAINWPAASGVPTAAAVLLSLAGVVLLLLVSELAATPLLTASVWAAGDRAAKSAQVMPASGAPIVWL